VKAKISVLTAMLIGAGGSFALMLYAGRLQQSALLLALFTGWVLAPFVALAWAYVASKNWTVRRQRGLGILIFSVATGSLIIYGSHALKLFMARSGFLYLAVPAGTWLVFATLISGRALAKRRFKQESQT
jgi:hypothetical protein